MCVFCVPLFFLFCFGSSSFLVVFFLFPSAVLEVVKVDSLRRLGLYRASRIRGRLRRCRVEGLGPALASLLVLRSGSNPMSSLDLNNTNAGAVLQLVVFKIFCSISTSSSS